MSITAKWLEWNGVWNSLHAASGNFNEVSITKIRKSAMNNPRLLQNRNTTVARASMPLEVVNNPQNAADVKLLC